MAEETGRQPVVVAVDGIEDALARMSEEFETSWALVERRTAGERPGTIPTP
jgi:hypothetical protein